jgi:hypothetical protein
MVFMSIRQSAARISAQRAASRAASTAASGFVSGTVAHPRRTNPGSVSTDPMIPGMNTTRGAGRPFSR